MLYSFFVIKKKKKALHEIIRPLSLSIIFVELSFRSVNPTMVVRNFKFMESYNSWNMYLQVKILTLDILTHMVPLNCPLICSHNLILKLYKIKKLH